MANRGNSRAAGAASAGQTYGETEGDYFDDPLENENDEGGSGGEGDGEGADDASLNAGEEQTPGGEEDLDAEPEPQPRRAQTRIQTLARENADLRREQQEMRERLDRLSRPAPDQRRDAPLPSIDLSILRENDADFNARVRQLPLEDQLEQRQTRSEAKAEFRSRVQTFQDAQARDKTDFDAFAATNALARKWSFKVEQERERLIREQGNYVPRREVLKWLLGADVLERRGGTGENRQAQRRVAAQTVKPSGSSRSDVGQDRRAKSEREARASRLEGVRI